MHIINAKVIDLINRGYFIECDKPACFYLTDILITKQIGFKVIYQADNYSIQLLDEKDSIKFKVYLMKHLEDQVPLKKETIEPSKLFDT